MRTLIEMPYKDTSILVAVDVPAELLDDEIKKVSVLEYLKGEPKSVEQNFDTISEMIIKYSKPIVESFETLVEGGIPLQKATAEFGLCFTGKGSIYLVEASAEATIKVTLEWAFKT